MGYDRPVVSRTIAQTTGRGRGPHDQVVVTWVGRVSLSAVAPNEGDVSVVFDNANIVAATLGGVLGLVLAFRLGIFRGSSEEPGPASAEPKRRTGYVATPQPSAAPILGAVGATLLGVGLATEPSLGVFSFALVIPGVALLALAVRSAFRRKSETRGP